MSTIAPTFARPAPVEVSSTQQSLALHRAIKATLSTITIEDVREQLCEEAAEAALIVAVGKHDAEMLGLIFLNVRMAYALRCVAQEFAIKAPSTADACALALTHEEVR
jgi:hypothetical protein